MFEGSRWQWPLQVAKQRSQKPFLKSKTDQRETFLLGTLVQTFTPSFRSKIHLPQYWARRSWYSEKHRTLMTSITYGPFPFVVLFWELKQLRVHITLRTQNLRPFRILYTNFERQTGFWRSTKGNYSSSAFFGYIPD